MNLDRNRAEVKYLSEYDKSYEQCKSDPYYLDDFQQAEVYKQTVLELRKYNYYLGQIKKVNEMSEVNQKQSDDRAEAERKIKMFNEGLKTIRKEFRELIKTRIIGNGKWGSKWRTWTWEELAEEFCTNRSDACKEWRRYIYWVAQQLGYISEVIPDEDE